MSEPVKAYGFEARPLISDAEIKTVFFRLYDRKVEDVEELKGHEDRNYKITTTSRRGAGCDKRIFVFKMVFVDEYDEQNLKAKINSIEEQFEVMAYITKRSFKCGQPLVMRDDNKVAVQTIAHEGQHKRCILYALSYIEGRTILDHYSESDIPDTIIYESGKLLAAWRKDLKNFPGRMDRQCSWNLANTETFRTQLKSCFEDDKRIQLVSTIFDKFEHEVIPIMETLDRGVIHGDFHDENLIVIDHTMVAETNGSQSERLMFEKSAVGIIDFADVHYAPFVFDLATAMAFFMLAAKSNKNFLQNGQYFLTGYMDDCELPEKELQILFICVATAYCRELVVCQHAYMEQGEKNDYLLSSLHHGWPQLISLWKDGKDRVLKTWIKESKKP